MFLPGMSNVLTAEKRQQVLALGRLGWSLRRIEEATGVRRETARSYLKAAGLTVQGRGRPPARPAKPAISSEVSTDSSVAPAAGTGTGAAAPGSRERPSRAPRASACEPYRYGILLPSAAPVRLPGQNEDLPGPDEGRTNVHGFSDTVESSIPSPVAVMAVLPSTTGTVSALQTCNLSMLSSPARSRPCQRFACRLTATGA